MIIQQPTVSQPDQPGRKDLRDLVQALVGHHEIRRHRIAARKAVIETVERDAGVLVQLAAIASYMASL